MRTKAFCQVKTLRGRYLCAFHAAALVAISSTAPGAWAAPPGQKEADLDASSLAQTLQDLRAQIQMMGSALREARDEAARSHSELSELRQEVHQTRVQLESMERHLRSLRPETGATEGVPAVKAEVQREETEPTSDARLAKLEEDQQLVSAKVDEQYQTKVESASKYRVRLSGIMLLNVFGNRGSVDNQDLPSLARRRGLMDSDGDFGATVRQTQLGLEVFGPTLAGARTSGEAHLDFFGGFPSTLDGVTMGVVRLRTAQVRLDWRRTSIIAGQDAPFFSPLSPTSLASLALPAFSYSGNLWTWTPQVRLERRVALSDVSSLRFQVGVLDPLSGEPPYHSFYRYAQAGERSRQPAYATRISWTHGTGERAFAVGWGGYYSRQNWALERKVDAWTGTVDWNLPLAQWLSVSGEFYRGRALGGLGGGIGRSVLASGPLRDAATTVVGLNSLGGWTQLKFRPKEKIEFNGVIGQDNPLSSDLNRFYQDPPNYYATLARNQTAMVNFIYRPRSALLFSVEYRRLHTLHVEEPKDTADHVNFGLGILF